jgi:hypothetical protein
MISFNTNAHLKSALGMIVQKMAPLRFILVKTKGAMAAKTATFEEILKAYPAYFRG